MQTIPLSIQKGKNSHKAVYHFVDQESGLNAYVAIHNDNLGPAVGGTRMFAYSHENEALSDVLRLSKAMSYKCALAGVRFGGGKGVIVGDPKKVKSKNLLRSYAQSIASLKGAFYTGEDVGITKADVQYMLTISPFFIGKEGSAGDPSPFAALSTFYAIQEAAGIVWGSQDLAGKSVAVKGVGKVGSELVRLLLEQQARVYVADIDVAVLLSLKETYPSVEIVDTKQIPYLKVDVYAPCAMGSEFDENSINHLWAKIICGAANNQLTSPDVARLMHKRGIIYVPDYVANAGGLINVADELEPGGYQYSRVHTRITDIKNTIQKLWELSEKRHAPMSDVADALAEEIIAK